jgi:hypothetical protein
MRVTQLNLRSPRRLSQLKIPKILKVPSRFRLSLFLPNQIL